MADELIPVNVWLAGRSYRIRIKASEEEAVRKAAKKADEKIMELRAHYAGKDDQDFVAMCLLMYATETKPGTIANSDTAKEVADMISRIDKVLDRD